MSALYPARLALAGLCAPSYVCLVCLPYIPLASLSQVSVRLSLFSFCFSRELTCARDIRQKYQAPGAIAPTRVTLICLPYMSALYVCLTCLPYMPALCMYPDARHHRPVAHVLSASFLCGLRLAAAIGAGAEIRRGACRDARLLVRWLDVGALGRAGQCLRVCRVHSVDVSHDV